MLKINDYKHISVDGDDADISVLDLVLDLYYIVKAEKIKNIVLDIIDKDFDYIEFDVNTEGETFLRDTILRKTEQIVDVSRKSAEKTKQKEIEELKQEHQKALKVILEQRNSLAEAIEGYKTSIAILQAENTLLKEKLNERICNQPKSIANDNDGGSTPSKLAQ